MALKAGDKLGSFEILSAIGAGGQGEVYKARDKRLDRFVAIKVLPAHLSSRPELRERFEREARTVSSLNHPHICTLYDMGKQDGTDFLVMEYLEGQTLADRLGKGPLPLADALHYAIQIADALDKAHRQGVVHRDLKPGNIMITKSGTKLLDFGLAKQSLPGSSAGAINSAVPTAGAAPLTAEGTILGTLQYMSPEQLEGQEADARSDIFAFGTTLYEMLTGRRAFAGKSQVSLMAAIIKEDPPPIPSFKPDVPKSLDRLVKLCMRKDTDKRYQTMADVLLRLEEITEGEAETEPALVSAHFRRRHRLALASTAIFALVSGALALPMLFREKTPEPVKVRFQVVPPLNANGRQIALAPDGKHLVATVTEKTGYMLWIRALEDLDGQMVSGTSDAGWPFWSPDGRFIAFFADGKLKKVDIFGGPPQTLCDAPFGYGGAWNSNGVIVFASAGTGPLFQVSASGGVPTQLTELDKSRDETAHRHPMFLPDGKHFIFLAASSKPENSAIYVSSLDSKERKRILDSTQKAMFVPPGRILFMRDTTLMAQSFDAMRLELRGNAFPVVEGVSSNSNTGTSGFAVSSNGILAYQGGAPSGQSQVEWFDRTGKQTSSIGDPGQYAYPVLSPDLHRLALFKPSGPTGDIWIQDLIRGTDTKLTFGPGTSQAPLWSPDGSRILFMSDRGGRVSDLYEENSGGVGSEDLLLKSDRPKYPLDWSLDGRLILYEESDPKTKWDLWQLPIGSDGKPGKPEMVLQTPFNEYEGRFSPDGKWIAYVSDQSGSNQVFVQSFPASGTKYQISTKGGVQPRWRRDGKELFFLSGETKGGGLGLVGAVEMTAVEISTSKGGAFQPGVPQKLFQTNVTNTNLRNSYDVTPDGQRFLINSAPTASSGLRPITVIVNWMSQGQPNKVP